MKKIDRETVQRILDTADIVDVVSDFVTLKRRGANYIGLCPFHNERTPSFSVSKSKGICKCFSCGKGGSPVNFIMELEQMSYQEALRWLARKYNIEIKEREETEQERHEASEREQMFAVNEFALKHFKDNLLNNEQGRAIGLSYFRGRGISDAMIEKFHLGYALEQSTVLFDAASRAGYKSTYLEQTGLVIRNEQGRTYDRFRGRVIYPVHSLSGKVVAFGGRTLRTDKQTAKYVNSPESKIYHKSNQLYGIYQARQAMARHDKCILVEGYMDVISMHQAGVDYTVASSGTSLTEGQIRMIHRFTGNVTLIYDSDAAGIKASLRGIDLLLAEGLNIKVLLLPDGDDPDTFARARSGEEVEAYIAEHETDFIRFKTNILLSDAGNDPLKRSQVISDILRSISVIPDAVTRSVYTDECARLMGVRPDMLHEQLKKLVTDSAYRQALKQQSPAPQSNVRDLTPEQVAAAETGAAATAAATTGTGASPQAPAEKSPEQLQQELEARQKQIMQRKLQIYEHAVMRLVVKYGTYAFSSFQGEDGQTYPLTVIEAVASEMDSDNLHFHVPEFEALFVKSLDLARNEWPKIRPQQLEKLLADHNRRIAEGRAELQKTTGSLDELQRKEQQLTENSQRSYQEEVMRCDSEFLSRTLMSDPDDTIRRLSTELVANPHQLSKIYTKGSPLPTERDLLGDLLPRAVLALKYEHLCIEIDSLNAALNQAQQSGMPDNELMALITRLMERKRLQAQFAQYLGDRNLSPGNLLNQ